MADEGFKRKLAAILSADVEGYSRLMDDDEEATVRTLTAYRNAINDLAQQYRGRVVDTTGDNLLAEFTSVVDAVNCAVEIQRELAERNAELPYNRKMEFRIGVNLGDVIEEEGRIYGDGVNIAARIEAMAEAGGICISGRAYDQVANKLGLEYENLGEHQVKNITRPIRVFRVLSFPGAAAHRVVQAKEAIGKRWRKIAIATGSVALAVVIAAGIWQFYQRESEKVEPASVENMAYPLPDKASIAILPFVNMTGDPEQEYIADAISENIISTLSKFPSLFVIARNSTFSYKGKHVKVSQVSEELGIRYVLEGSILKSGDRLRVTAQLIDALEGHHLWTETYDRDETDLFIIMDEITLEIAKALSVELMPFGLPAGTKIADTKSLQAWTLYAKGIHYTERLSKEDNAKAREFLEQAIELDPNLAVAWSMLANVHFLAARYGWSTSRSESLKQTKKLALKAIEIDDSYSQPHIWIGNIYLLKKKYDEALAEYKKAVALGPNDAWAHWYLGRQLFFTGQTDKAIPLLKKALRFNPYPHWAIPGVLGRVYYHSGQYEDALAMFEKVYGICKEGGCSMKWPHLYLSMVYVELGRDEEARSHMQKVLEHDPNFNIEGRRKQNLFKDQALNERELAAHRKAGAPERPPSQ
jgi:TolB-like protein/class 3 adenylate cyclase/Tfp pilus assembly protein PilF